MIHRLSHSAIQTENRGGNSGGSRKSPHHNPPLLQWCVVGWGLDGEPGWRRGVLSRHQLSHRLGHLDIPYRSSHFSSDEYSLRYSVPFIKSCSSSSRHSSVKSGSSSPSCPHVTLQTLRFVYFILLNRSVKVKHHLVAKLLRKYTWGQSSTL